MAKIMGIEVIRLYEQHQRKMLGIANQILNDQQMSEDVVQESFIRLIKYLDKNEVENEQHLKGLIVVITKRLAINAYNKRKRLNETEYAERTSVSSQDNLEDTVAIKLDNLSEINRIEQQIKDNHLEVLTLKYRYQYSIKEIAELLNRKEATIKVLLHRARKEAKLVLEACDEG